jgi:hypothetical protein
MGRKVPVVSSLEDEEVAGDDGAGRLPASQPVRRSAERRAVEMSAVFMEAMCADPVTVLTAPRGPGVGTA